MIDQPVQSFEDCLNSYLEKEVSGFLLENSFIDQNRNVRKEYLLNALKGSKKEWRNEVLTLVGISDAIGVAYEYLGEMEFALQYYWIGTYAWPYDSPTFPDQKENSLMYRSTLAMLQLDSAICNDRIGNKERARQLYEWAAENNRLTGEEIESHAYHKQYYVIWERLIDRAYALACLERWEECLEVAGEAEKWVMKDRSRKSAFGYDYTPFKLLPIVAALARHFVGPTEESRKEARMKLSLRSIKARDR